MIRAGGPAKTLVDEVSSNLGCPVQAGFAWAGQFLAGAYYHARVSSYNVMGNSSTTERIHIDKCETNQAGHQPEMRGDEILGFLSALNIEWRVSTEGTETKLSSPTHSVILRYSPQNIADFFKK